jgi:integrase
MRTRVSDTLDLAGGKLHLYKRPNSNVWQCATYLAGTNHRQSTKQHTLERAKEFAEDWYLALRLKNRTGELRKGGPTFADAAEKWVPEYKSLTVGERNPRYVKQHSDRLRLHLLPFFGSKPVASISPQTLKDYLVHRMQSRKNKKTGEPIIPSRSLLHHETVTLRMVLRMARDLGWIKFIPDLRHPYRKGGKISHRAWFSPEEYKKLYEATRERAANPPKAIWKWECEQLHDFVLFMVNTGLRPDEAARLEFRDVEIAWVGPRDNEEEILEISVRGKRGTGYCKSMPGAVLPFRRLQTRMRSAAPTSHASKGGAVNDAPKLVLPQPTDLIFPAMRHHHLNAVLEELDLKKDREGLRRSAYSLRHTYICLRLMEGADIYQIAKNCRTSVEMIEKFYAAHIKNVIDAAAVNVRRDRSDGRPKTRGTNGKRPTAGGSGGYPKRRR